MRHSVGFFAAAVSVGLGVSAAGAAITPDGVPPRTTADLVALCSPQSDDPQAGAATAYCYGFAEGAVDIVLSYSAAGPQSRRPFCLPSPPPKLSDVVADFVNWANGDAASLQKPAVVGLASYLVEHFPCPHAGGTSRGGKR
jgi:hypothetical protein